MTITDKKLENMLARKNVSKSTRNNYDVAFKYAEEIIGHTPTEMLKIARREEKPYLNDDGQPDFIPLDERSLSLWETQLYQYLLQKGLQASTIRIRLIVFRGFFSYYNVRLPKMVQIHVPKKLILHGDIPTIEDIRKAVTRTPSLRDKSIILSSATSGLRSIDLRNMKVGTFIKACGYKTIEEFMNADLSNCIPEFFLQPEKTKNAGNPCLTHMTPECVCMIQEYWKTRDSFTLDEYVFTVEQGNKKNKQLKAITWISIFNRVDKAVFNGDGWFHAHSLRAFYISTIKRHSGDLTKTCLMSGHKPPMGAISRSYDEIDSEGILELYKDCIPELSVRDTKVHHVSDETVVKLEQKINDLKNDLKNSNERLNEFYNILDQ